MGFLKKLFGEKEEEKFVTSGLGPKVKIMPPKQDQSIPPEKVGFDGSFDENGLAKRVAKALDLAGISDEIGLWVAQRGSVVVLKYNEDAKDVLAKAEQAAKEVEGATAVEVQPNT